MKKSLIIIVLLLVSVLVFTSCEKEVILYEMPSGTLTLLSTKLDDSWGNVSPETSGNKILSIRLSIDYGNPDLDELANKFFGETPATVTVNGKNTPCKSIAFEDGNGQSNIVLLFEIASDTTELTFSVPSFADTQITLEK